MQGNGCVEIYDAIKHAAENSRAFFGRSEQRSIEQPELHQQRRRARFRSKHDERSAHARSVRMVAHGGAARLRCARCDRD